MGLASFQRMRRLQRDRQMPIESKQEVGRMDQSPPDSYLTEEVKKPGRPRKGRDEDSGS